MEQDLNTDNYEIIENNDSFKLEYTNQNIKDLPEFQKWYKNAKDYIKRENIRRGKAYANRIDDYSGYFYLLTIQFCSDCNSYTICYLSKYYSYIQCKQCNKLFCIGCKRKYQERNTYYRGDSLCLKGYLKALYIRIIYRRTDLEETNGLFHLIHITIF